MARMRSPLSFFVLLFAVVVAPLAHAQREFFTPDQLDYIQQKWPDAKRTGTGLRYIIQKPGDGISPRPGDSVSVLYVGALLDGTVFDKQLDPAHPLAFRVDRGAVIDGWNQILKLMKLHEKRLVIIPAALAYGSRGRPPAIPRDAVLVFEMELVDVSRE
jgi:FKBP-type peptidyl-prolyl cis-trans isomerase